jgi:hypothetical protein
VQTTVPGPVLRVVGVVEDEFARWTEGDAAGVARDQLLGVRPPRRRPRTWSAAGRLLKMFSKPMVRLRAADADVKSSQCPMLTTRTQRP